MKKENRKFFVLFLILTVNLSFGAASEDQKPVIPVVDGHLGSCSAEFTVKGAGESPLYDAKIDVSLKYGFLGLRKMSLQVGTNADGQARVAGLPDDEGKTYRFVITRGQLSKSVLMRTSDGCNAVFQITLDE